MKTTTLRNDYPTPSDCLTKIQRLLRSGDVSKAVVLGNKIGIEMTNEEIATEIEFLRRLEAARKKASGAEHSA